MSKEVTQTNGRLTRFPIFGKGKFDRSRKSVVFHSTMGIGDCCLFTIVLESLVKQYPGRFLCDVVGKYADQIFKNNPNVDPTLNHDFAHHIQFEHNDNKEQRREMMNRSSVLG